MIIRLSLGDSDFISKLEDFCKGLKYKMFVIDEIEDPIWEDYNDVDAYSKAYREYANRRKEMDDTRRYLMNPENQFKKNSSEHRKIKNEVLRLWHIYIENTYISDLIPKVSIQYSLDEKWENGEATYYWTAYDICITQ